MKWKYYKERALAAVQRGWTWMQAVASGKGWHKWALLGGVAVAFILFMSLAFDGVDYKQEPSALVPRSVYAYAETNNLDALLKEVGAWPVWRDRKTAGSEQWSQLQVNFAGLIGDKVVGLGTRLPLYLLSRTQKAALALVEGDAESPESWALLLELADPAAILAEINVEPGLTLELVPGSQGVYKLTGAEDTSLYFGVAAPWFMISSDSKLPLFAVTSLKSPGFSLATSQVLPDWKRNVVVRGMFSPSALSSAQAEEYTTLSAMADWMSYDTRMTFMSRLSGGGEFDTRFAQQTISDRPGGGGIWSLFKFIFGLLGMVCLVLIASIGIIMLGYGGWLKALAIRAGIAPAGGPGVAKPSEAFKEDAGLRAAEKEPVQAEVITVETVVDETTTPDNATISEPDDDAPGTDLSAGLPRDE